MCWKEDSAFSDLIYRDTVVSTSDLEEASKTRVDQCSPLAEG